MSLISSVSGGLLRITTFTSSGTWTKGNDVGAIVVDVVGAGGGQSSDGTNGVEVGGNSSFGSHCSANGGAAGGGALSPAVGAGGSASGGDINLSGRPGWANSVDVVGRAESFGPLSPFGYGGASITGRPGGAGGYSRKFIESSALSSSETVTVGSAYSGGAAGTGTAYTRGIGGIVIVYEYSK